MVKSGFDRRERGSLGAAVSLLRRFTTATGISAQPEEEPCYSLTLAQNVLERTLGGPGQSGGLDLPLADNIILHHFLTSSSELRALLVTPFTLTPSSKTPGHPVCCIFKIDQNPSCHLLCELLQ